MQTITPPKGYLLIESNGAYTCHLAANAQNLKPLCNTKPSKKAIRWADTAPLWVAYGSRTHYRIRDGRCSSCWALSGHAIHD